MRRIIAVVLLAVSVLLAPVAVLGAWARTTLLDTDHFVEIFGPLAAQPDVQEFVTDQVTDAVTSSLPIDSLIGDLFDGLSGLPIPPRTGAALLQLEPLAVAGVNSIVHGQVERLVASPQFAQVWEASLRETHARLMPVLDGDPESVLQLDDDGLLSLSLGPIVASVQERMLAQGITIARLIPDVDRSVEIVSSDSLVLLRTIYRAADIAGYWLPFVVAGLGAAGIAAARNRVRALAWTAVGFASAFVLLGVALTIARGRASSLGVLPGEASVLMFDHFTAGLSARIGWALALSLLVAVAGALASHRKHAVVELRDRYTACSDPSVQLS